MQLGQEPGLFTEIHQPLDPLTRYFVSGKVGYQNDVVNVFDDAGRKLSEVRLSGPRLELGAGREFGTWGEGRVGYRWGDGTGEIITGTPAPDFDVAQGEVFMRLAIDTFDRSVLSAQRRLRRARMARGARRAGRETSTTIRFCSATRTPIPGVSIPSSAGSLVEPRWTTTRRSRACFSSVASCVFPDSTKTN